jgi:integrase/recombinase XerD
MHSNGELLIEYTIHLRAERGLSENTIAAYIFNDLDQYAQVLDLRKTTLFAAQKEDVAAFIQHLATHEIGPRSRARKIAALRRFYRWLILNELIDTDPTRLTVLPKMPKLLPRPVEARTVELLLESTGKRASSNDATPTELRDHAMISVLYSAGIRVSELCGIRQNAVSMDTRSVIVRGKGDKERIVPLGEAAVSAIENYLRFARPHLVKSGRGHQRSLWLSEQGTQITRRRVHQIVVAAGGKDEQIHPHRLRHSCATHMLRAGAGLRDVQELLGHATLGTTQIYTQVTKDHLQQSHARFHPRGGK